MYYKLYLGILLTRIVLIYRIIIFDLSGSGGDEKKEMIGGGGVRMVV